MKIGQDSTYIPEISVTVRQDDAHRLWILVTDNGIGMDEHILSEYFLKVGNSYYNSPEFERLCRKLGSMQPFIPIARFGIGLVSGFMIADAIEVTTRHICSPRNDNISRLVRIERMGGLAFVTRSPDDTYGTCVGIRLRPDVQANYDWFALKAISYLKNTIVRPAFDIRVKLTQDTFILKHDNQISFKPTGITSLSKKHIEPIIIDLQRWSSLTGTLVLLFGVGDDSKLSHTIDGHKIVVGQHGAIYIGEFLEGYAGNRVTVNGFKMSLKKILNIFKYGHDRICALIDVSVVGDSNIDYDVSRAKIIGSGQRYLRDSIRSATLKCLTETKIIERLSEGTRSLILKVTAPEQSKFRASHPHLHLPQINSMLLDQVASRLPKDTWPKSIHKQIAKELGVTNDAVWRAIDVLIATKRITKPTSSYSPSSDDTDGCCP